ncbi:MAG: lpxK [Rhodospirillales bacterium]|nr:lpxK [Rhodospirillales bacterium]
MKSPAFWDKPDALMGRLLAPLGWAYAEVTAWRLAHGKPWRAPVPVICIGNLTAGGAGKTPIVRDLALRLTTNGVRPAILSRGYGGLDRGPLRVDPARHGASKVGDEPLLLARDAPCWIARDRAAGARAIVADGAGVILMDDGLQNPDLIQDLRVIVVDGAAGFGNGHAIPAGPLREHIDAGIKRAHAMVVVGDDRHDLVRNFSSQIDILQLTTQIRSSELPVGARLVAFAGIGRPEKFRSSLIAAGAEMAAFQAFADHHPYTGAELQSLASQADSLGADLATTEKDWVRLEPEWRLRIKAIPLSVTWKDESALTSLLSVVMRRG